MVFTAVVIVAQGVKNAIVVSVGVDWRGTFLFWSVWFAFYVPLMSFLMRRKDEEKIFRRERGEDG